MAWTSPMTAVANTVFTAAQFNTFVRDNLLETAPAKAGAAGQLIVATGANQIIARTPSQNGISGSDTSASTTYVDLSVAGPSVTANTGATALVFLYADMFNSSSFKNFVSVAVSNASSIAAADTNALSHADTQDERSAGVIYLTGLTVGTNTFKMMYRVNGGTGTWNDRKIAVVPIS
jgi:hypothetical protein